MKLSHLGFFFVGRFYPLFNLLTSNCFVQIFWVFLIQSGKLYVSENFLTSSRFHLLAYC